MDSLSPQECITVLEPSSPILGRKWLAAIPVNPSPTDFEVAAYLNIRTLSPGHHSLCQRCRIGNTLGHDEKCVPCPELPGPLLAMCEPR